MDGLAPYLTAALGVLLAALSFYFSLVRKSLGDFSVTRLVDMARDRGRAEKIESSLERAERAELVAGLGMRLANLSLYVYFLVIFSDCGPLHFWPVVGALLSALAVVLLVGEALARSVANHNAERVVLASLVPFVRATYALDPLEPVAGWIDRVICRISGAHRNGADEELAEEIGDVVDEAVREGALAEEEEEMIKSFLEFRTADAAEIMTPRTEVMGVAADTTLAEAAAIAADAGHSRLPVYQDTLDEIVCVLYVKDLLRLPDGVERATTAVSKIMREPFFIPETMKIDDLLKEFRRRKVHIAIVLDEYGGTAGVATVEDVLEELVGEIEDEYDKEEPATLTVTGKGTAEIDARVHADELEDALDVHIPEGDYDTVGGFVFSELGRIPRKGETFALAGVEFTVLDADPRRIKRLSARRIDDGRARRPTNS